MAMLTGVQQTDGKVKRDGRTKDAEEEVTEERFFEEVRRRGGKAEDVKEYR